MSDAADDTSCSDGSDEVSGAELVVKQKAGELVNEFDRYLDPFELFHSPSNSNPPRVNLVLQMLCDPSDDPTYPPQLAELLNHAFSICMRVSSWRTDERGTFLPKDWREHRALLEVGWPSRARSFWCIREVLREYSVSHADTLRKYYRTSCSNLVRKAIRLHGTVAFWVHLANKPGSTGFRSAINACHDLMANRGEPAMGEEPNTRVGKSVVMVWSNLSCLQCFILGGACEATDKGKIERRHAVAADAARGAHQGQSGGWQVGSALTAR